MLLAGMLSGAGVACNAILGNDPVIFDPNFGAEGGSTDDATDATNASDTQNNGDGAIGVDGSDANPPDLNDGGGCDAGAKSCFAGCVSVTDPSVGCTSSACDPCSVTNAVAACTGGGGACAIGKCSEPFADCNQDASDGCEVNLAMSTSCGGCGQGCAAAAPYCSLLGDGGHGCVTNCPAGQPTLCTNTGTCSDTNNDPQHCGSCTNTCVPPAGGTSVCSSGSCDFVCNGVGNHRCGNACVSNAAATSCGPTSCSPCAAPPSGQGSATCENPSNGTCGVACNSGYHRCGNDCVSNASASSCGTSSCTPCPAPPSGGGTAVCADPVIGTCVVSCSAGFHTCNIGGASDCKSDTDVAFCSATAPAVGCVACVAGANVATMKCLNQCVIDKCNAGYDNLDNNITNGCETPNPLSIQPANLALWLRSDVGVISDGSGAVSQWLDQSGNNAQAVQTTASLRPTLSTGPLWPLRPNLPVLNFNGANEMAVDFSKMMSVNGFTLFLVAARLGTPDMCLVGSFTNPLPVSCCTQQAAAMELCTYNNTKFEFEPYCDPFSVTGIANTAGTYQPNLQSLWWDPVAKKFSLSLNGGTAATNASTFCPNAGPLANLDVPARLGRGYAGSFFSGLVAEVVLYKTILSSTDRAAVASYIKTKWGTP